MIERFQVTSGDHLIRGLLSLPENSCQFAFKNRARRPGGCDGGVHLSTSESRRRGQRSYMNEGELAAGRFPCVIFSHGLVSSKESSKYIYLAERFCAAGIAACRFDYHGCGESGGHIAETTLTIRIRDLESVLEHVIGGPSIDSDRLGILGSSFGGSTALLEAAKNPKVKCVALWATPYMLEKKKDESISDISFRSSIFEDFSRYDLLSEARRVSHAIVIHGELDEVVPCSEGKAIYENLKRPKKFIMINRADHTFTDLAHRDRAAELSLAWFSRYL